MAALTTTTKRQKRKQPNDKHAWPQQPKIQSPASRAKAYLRVAGLTNQKADIIDPQLDMDSPQVKFGRLLGSSEQRIRHKAILTLQKYLKARSDMNANGLSEMDLLKMWKGLWFTLYMADKAAVQDELAKQIAQLIWCVAGTEEEDECAGQAYMNMVENSNFDEHGMDPEKDEEQDGSEEESSSKSDEESSSKSDEEEEEEDDSVSVEMEEVENTLEEADDDEDVVQEADTESDLDHHEIPHCRGAHLSALFVGTFFATIRRDWGKMDKYRVDKFYTLLRYMLHEVYKYMSIRHWNMGIIRLFNDVMFEEILSQPPNGPRYHLIDICLDELAAVNGKAPMSLTEATFLDVLEPFFAMAQTGAGGDTLIHERAMEKVLEPFLRKYSYVCEEALDADDANIMEQVHVGTVADFIFEMATDGATPDKFRQSLYGLHKKYLRSIKSAGRDVRLDHEEEEETEQPAKDAGTGNMVEEARLEDTSTKEEEPLSVSDMEPKGKKAKRRRTKKKKGAAALEIDTSNAKKEEKVTREEVEVTISLEEQRSAKRRATKDTANFKVPKEKHSSKSEGQSQKRVQFGQRNQAVSWKKSMQSLRSHKNIDMSATPEKSILLNPGAAVRRKGNKRKRALDFF